VKIFYANIKNAAFPLTLTFPPGEREQQASLLGFLKVRPTNSVTRYFERPNSILPEGEGKRLVQFLTVVLFLNVLLVTNLSAQTNSASATNAASRATHIDSDRADFDLNARTAIYRGNVRVSDPEMKLSCEWLVADLPQSGHINHIVAETNVVIDLMQSNETAHATCEMAVYDYAVKNGVTNETVTLTGNPVLKDARGMSRGDAIIWYPAENRLSIKNPRGTAFVPVFNHAETNSESKPNQKIAPQ
jgi:lipopolysaccharide transport protein LptA